ncbi:MAG: hypothetical protein QOE90_318 [Thermoplasmata archaeon]|nr:hypothetical protein [Thermoplasmata archaeon]
MRAPLHPDLAVVLAASVAVVVLLAVSLGTAPAAIAAKDAPLHDGQRVRLDARVLAASGSARGLRLVVADDTARLTVLGQAGLAQPQPGDRVRLVGLVAQLSDGLGLSAETITVTQRAATQPIDPAQVARQPQLYEGARVLLRGEARDGALAGGGARMLLSGLAPPAPGSWLAAGTVFYDTAHAAYELRVDAWSRPS